MATSLTAGELKVTVTEALTITAVETADNKVWTTTNTHTFANIIRMDQRLVQLSTTNETTLAKIDTTVEGAGQYIRSKIKYIRVTNLDDSVSAYIGLLGASDSGWVELKGDSSILLTTTGVEGAASFVALDNLETIKAKAATAGVALEIVVAEIA